MLDWVLPNVSISWISDGFKKISSRILFDIGWKHIQLYEFLSQWWSPAPDTSRNLFIVVWSAQNTSFYFGFWYPWFAFQWYFVNLYHKILEIYLKKKYAVTHFKSLVAVANDSSQGDPEFDSRPSHPSDLPCQMPGSIGSVLGLVGQASVYCGWMK